MSLEQQYQNAVENALKVYDVGVRFPWQMAFWERWIRMHREYIREVEAAKSAGEALAKMGDETLKKRERMVSSLLQGAKGKMLGNDGAVLAQLVRQHDEILRQILQHALSETKAELKKAHATRKALSGYAETISGRGIR